MSVNTSTAYFVNSPSDLAMCFHVSVLASSSVTKLAHEEVRCLGNRIDNHWEGQQCALERPTNQQNIHQTEMILLRHTV